MKKFLFFLLAICSMTTSAGDFFFDYCGGQLGSSATSLLGTNKTVETAIRIPKSTLSGFVGNKIKAVYFGFPTTSTVRPTLTGWIRTDNEGDNIASSAEYTATEGGWQVLTLTTPYTITGEEDELWVGVGWYQSSRLSIVTYAGTKDTDGCWTRQNAKTGYGWYSVGSEGSLCIRALMEGNVPQRDLTVSSLTPGKYICPVGTTITASGEVQSRGVVQSPNTVLNWTLKSPSGVTVGSGQKTFSTTFTQGTKQTFDLSIPTTSCTETGAYALRTEVVWASGNDDTPTDNVKTAYVTMVNNNYTRRTMLLEEGTGTWCGFCVRGIVGIETMKTNHPTDFIGLSVHNSDGAQDPFEVADPYLDTRAKETGYPACITNRNGEVYDPEYADIEASYNAMDHIAIASMSTTATCTDNTNITASTNVNFDISAEGKDYRIIYVLCEDNLTAVQKNYYGDGSWGAMGGFENLSNPCVIQLNDVVRGFFPSNTGASGSIPSAVTRGTPVNYTLTFAIPTGTYTAPRNLANTWLCTMLVDGKTNEVMQACKSSINYGSTTLTGDVNADGNVNDADVTALKNIVLSRNADTNGTANVNAKGDITISDITTLIDTMLRAK